MRGLRPSDDGFSLGFVRSTLWSLLVVTGAFAAFAFPAVGAASTSEATLTTFAGGNASDTLHFRAPCWNNATEGFLFPDGANVTSAALTVTRGASDAGVSGTLQIGVHTDLRNPEASVSLNDTVPTARVTLDATAFTNFIASPSAHPPWAPNGSAFVPLVADSCSLPRGWDITFDDILITYSVGADATNRPPTFSGSLDDITVLEGGSVVSAAALSNRFEDPDGDPLSFSILAVQISDPGWSYVRVRIEGDSLNVSSTPPWVGSLGFRVRATDIENATAESNVVTVRVLVPDEPPLFAGPIPDLSAPSGMMTTGLLDGSRYFEDPNGLPLAFSIAATDGVLEWSSVQLEFRGSFLDVMRAGDAGFSGTVCLTVRATDGNGSSGDSNWFCIMFHAHSSPPTAPLPEATGISVSGADPGALSAGVGYTLRVETESPLPPSAQVQWFVDGELVGTGETISGLTFTAGAHEVRAVVSDGTTTKQTTVMVTAAVRPVGPPPPDLFGRGLLFSAVLFFALAGLALSRMERARFFVFGLLVAAVFARLKGESLLNHFVRGRLYQVIGEHPGVRFNELKRLADVSNGSAVHHLRIMARGGLIRIAVEGTSTRFFVTGVRLEDDAYGLLDADSEILEAVQQSPGLSVAALSRRIERSRSATSRAVKRLSTLGYVRRERRGREAAVYPRLKGARDDRPLTAPAPKTPANSARLG